MTPALLFERLKKALALGLGTHEPEDLVHEVQEGTMQCFHNEDAVVFTRIVQSPRKKTMHVFVVAGEMGAVMGLQPQLDDLCRKEGVELQTCVARKGMEKPLPTIGWEPRYTTFVREVPRV